MAAIHHPKPEVVLSQPWIEVRVANSVRGKYGTSLPFPSAFPLPFSPFPSLPFPSSLPLPSPLEVGPLKCS